MTRPRLEKTKPIFADWHASRMVAGRVIVIPIPTAAPLIAAIVGFEHLWMASATLLITRVSNSLED